MHVYHIGLQVEICVSNFALNCILHIAYQWHKLTNSIIVYKENDYLNEKKVEWQRFHMRNSSKQAENGNTEYRWI